MDNNNVIIVFPLIKVYYYFFCLFLESILYNLLGITTKDCLILDKKRSKKNSKGNSIMNKLIRQNKQKLKNLKDIED